MLLEAEIAGREEFIPDQTNNKFFMPSGLVGLPDFKKFELIVDPESLPFVILRCIANNITLFSNTFKDCDCLGNRRRFNNNLLESTFQRPILFNVLSELI